ncbi:precorrin-2 C(20)-methyltransferase [Afifella sp. IM 167]|uniref:precorrin-2 C(20)-methyltransferase n=1 Tax=Afifella sp. IM 167 TaxID=2033586 RepID=UPI001CCB6B35|nr:precorrin-2 C(20)-methyltransferase [Afifella sp. IM 167]MBZ8134976.1 precorrin-2 C(20)-methyltransferase [Afifella sp. IM 167]
MTGTLYGIGVGPGDPELVTLKAARLIAAAPVVAYPAPDSGESFARRIAAAHIASGTREIAIRIAMRPGAVPAEPYDRAAEAIGAHLEAGRGVAVLCEGDPFFYGTFMYLHDRLAGRFACEVVPGVSSLTAVAAAAGRPLTRRTAGLSVFPATLDDEALTARLNACEAAAILKVGRHLSRLKAIIAALGRTEEAVYVAHASLPEERVVPLAELAEDEAPYFSMILVAKAAP